jgi:crotonobetainyl-CoA:carnitine CoA-transferase CaiB-like acyl-CoA transferase
VLRMAAPGLGQHNEEILGRIGVGRDALSKLRAEGIV